MALAHSDPDRTGSDEGGTLVQHTNAERQAILRAMRAGDVEIDQMLTGLTVRHLTGIPLSGYRSVRDVIAHCIAHEQFALDEIGAALGAGPMTLGYADLDSFNAGAVAAMRPLEPRMVVAAWRTSRRGVIALVEGLPDAAFDPDGEIVARLDDTIAGALGNNTYEHWATHLADIRRGLGGHPT